MPARIPANSGLFAINREISVCVRLWLGGLELPTKRLSAARAKPSRYGLARRDFQAARFATSCLLGNDAGGTRSEAVSAREDQASGAAHSVKTKSQTPRFRDPKKFC